jgi:hypothetical protein
VMSLMNLMGPDAMVRPVSRDRNKRFALSEQFGGDAFPWMRPGGMAPPQGGYDSSGINPHGMYTNQQFPRNPGGFQPMGLLARLSAYR